MSVNFHRRDAEDAEKTKAINRQGARGDAP